MYVYVSCEWALRPVRKRTNSMLGKCVCGIGGLLFLHSKVPSLTLRESEKYVKTRSTKTAVAVSTTTKQHNKNEQQQKKNTKTISTWC
jgi:hypothetical protein